MNIKYKIRKTGELIIENPPAEGLLKFLYDNPFGKKAILPVAKRKFISTLYGKQMDKASSKKKIEPFVKELKIDMSESLRAISDFKSFNDFFHRKLKTDARPIEKGLVSPGDGKLIAFDKVSELKNFYVKGSEFTVAKFLNNGPLAEKYKNSSLIILRLAPNDYHRYHFPYSGTPTDITKIKGDYFSVSPYALIGNFARVFCENKREYCELITEEKGDILIAPVGATMVGGIIDTFSPNQKVEKGDEMGYFKFGGSTILMLVDRDKFKIDKDILENTQNKIETAVRMGEKIAE